MPDIRDQGTVDALARAFIANGRKQMQAMIDVGYKPAYAKSYCGKLWADERVKAAIQVLELKLAEEHGYTIAQAQVEYEQARQHAITHRQPSAEVSAITGKARLYGMDKDSDVETQPDALTAEEVAELRALTGAATGLRISKGA